MNENKNYKDSVFTTLFNNPDILRELYCALEGVTLPPDIPVSINTLEKVLLDDKFNDISFEIGGRLIVLIEHQSTINPNMALRMFQYISKIYEKTIKRITLYSEKLITIPYPEFFVLYNGKKPFPDEAIIKLSDAFEKPETMGLPEKIKPMLELEVKVININHGRNEILQNRCSQLAEYSEFVAEVESIRKQENKEEALLIAIKKCQKRGILKEFLEKHAAEVFNMMITEWNLEEAKEVWIDEAREEGIERGIEKEQKYVLSLIDQGLSAEEIKDRILQTQTKTQ